MRRSAPIQIALRPTLSRVARGRNSAVTSALFCALSGRYGKTEAARRTLPMTPRVRRILEARWLSAGKPASGWVFPVKASKSGHITHSSLKKAHARALKLSKVELVIYSLRHAFATRLATSPGMDAWTLCKIMGWSSLAVAMGYIHPSEQPVLDAFEQKHELSGTGDKTGDTIPNVDNQAVIELSSSSAIATN